MSDSAVKIPGDDDDAAASSRKYLQPDRPSWISRWTHTSSKPTSSLNNSKDFNDKTNRLFDTKPGAVGKRTTNFHLTTGPEDCKNERLNHRSFPVLNLSHEQRNTHVKKFRDKDTSFARRNSIPNTENTRGSTSCDMPLHTDAQNPIMVFGRHFTNDRVAHSTFLVHRKDTDTRLSLGNGSNHDMISNNNFLPSFLKKQNRDIQTTTRIFTTFDTPEICHTLHRFLFTKETRLDTLLSTYSNDGPRYSRGVKIQPLWSSTDSEEKQNIGDCGTSKVSLRNESSAETDMMEMDAFEGVASSTLNKDVNVHQTSVNSHEEKVRGKLPIIEIPNINEEFLVHLPGTSSKDAAEQSSSRTQSFDAENFLFCAEKSLKSQSKSNEHRDPVGLEPRSQWVKRLKLSSSDSFGIGTKSSIMGESSSHEKKINLIFKNIGKCSGSSSNRTFDKHRGKEHVGSDLKSVSQRYGSIKESQGVIHAHSWIRRWCHNHNQTETRVRKPAAFTLCEPHTSRFDEAAKKQCPSIAAMALMGKAITGFRQRELRKRGPLTLWNT